jgi:hypothetical protein
MKEITEAILVTNDMKRNQKAPAPADELAS